MAAVISLIFGAIELVVGLRFVFLLIGVNPDTPFVSWIYSISSALVAPFAGILGHSVIVPSGLVVHSVFDPAALIALVVYGAVGGILMALFGFTRHTTAV